MAARAPDGGPAAGACRNHVGEAEAPVTAARTRDRDGPTAECRPHEADGSSASGLARQQQDDTSSTIERARRHVAAVVSRCPEAATVDEATWVAAILAHLEPLPANRAFRVLAARHRPSSVRDLAPAVARRLTPPAGTRPQPTCSEACLRTHREAA